MRETRKLAAILIADVVAYGQFAGADKDLTLACLRGPRSDLIDLAIGDRYRRMFWPFHCFFCAGKRVGKGTIAS